MSPLPTPGVRGEAPSDELVTTRLERLPSEITPAPLPPSPADSPDGWFEQIPTNPEALPELPTLQARGAPADLLTEQSESRSAGPKNIWLLPVLIAATSLAVGMVLGALLFGAGKTHSDAPANQPCIESAQSPK